MQESQQAEIESVVVERMNSFVQAEQSLDATGLLEHLHNTSDFCVYNDGHALNFDELAEGLSTTYQSLESISGGIEHMVVRVLSESAALVTSEFREQIVDLEGGRTSNTGIATWLWREINGRWGICYGHVEHYPDTETETS